ncbi:uncharacterized protein [Euphorbia lathyris]|uniref:uncharacterized protein isoform X2 n=1 Tax=Euphorbia lathyris TaxID=212925 RepID=UPI0033131000
MVLLHSLAPSTMDLNNGDYGGLVQRRRRQLRDNNSYIINYTNSDQWSYDFKAEKKGERRDGGKRNRTEIIHDDEDEEEENVEGQAQEHEQEEEEPRVNIGANVEEQVGWQRVLDQVNANNRQMNLRLDEVVADNRQMSSRITAVDANIHSLRKEHRSTRRRLFSFFRRQGIVTTPSPPGSPSHE